MHKLWGVAEFASGSTDTTVNLPITTKLNFAATFVSDRSQIATGVSAYGIIRESNTTLHIYRNPTLYVSEDGCTYLLITL